MAAKKKPVQKRAPVTMAMLLREAKRAGKLFQVYKRSDGTGDWGSSLDHDRRYKNNKHTRQVAMRALYAALREMPDAEVV